jgi:hypothetical protein
MIEDIIRMAREAGFNLEHGFLLRVTGIDEDLERFAALVRADERNACAAIAKQWDTDHPTSNYGGCIANLIEARGQA